MTVNSSVKGMAFGNILFGGLIGAGVDTMTGAACDYPSLIPVPMDCQESPNESTSSGGKEVSEKVVKAAEALDCHEPRFVMKASDGSRLFTAKCEENQILMRCDSEGCKATEFTEGQNEQT